MQALIESLKNPQELEPQSILQLIEQASFQISKDEIKNQEIIDLAHNIKNLPQNILENTLGELLNLSMHIFDRNAYFLLDQNNLSFEIQEKCLQLEENNQEQEKQSQENQDTKMKQQQFNADKFDQNQLTAIQRLKNYLGIYILNLVKQQNDKKYLLIEIFSKIEQTSNVEKKMVLSNLLLEIIPELQNKHIHFKQLLPVILQTLNSAIEKYMKYRQKYEGANEMTLPVRIYYKNIEEWVIQFLNKSFKILINLEEIQNQNKNENNLKFVPNLYMSDLEKIQEDKTLQTQYSSQLIKHYLACFLMDILSGILEVQNQQIEKYVRQYDIGQTFNILSVAEIYLDFLNQTQQQPQNLISKTQQLKYFFQFYYEFYLKEDSKKQYKQSLIKIFTKFFVNSQPQSQAQLKEQLQQEVEQRVKKFNLENLTSQQKEQNLNQQIQFHYNQLKKQQKWEKTLKNRNCYSIPFHITILSMLDTIGYTTQNDIFFEQDFLLALDKFLKQFDENSTFQIFQKILESHYQNTSVIVYIIDYFRNSFCIKQILAENSDPAFNFYIDRQKLLSLLEKIYQNYQGENLTETAELVQSVIVFYQFILKRLSTTDQSLIQTDQHILSQKNVSEIVESFKKLEKQILTALDMAHSTIKQQINQIENQASNNQNKQDQIKIKEQIGQKQQLLEQVQFSLSQVKDLVNELDQK
ncbi:hypothetical protein PPERSA_00363 [Pseudocohnilembus persalinus]|uniref:Uncharacterized protein n=1 Tax=Pseudocohnilembus persalinus TaxID=266149 RepID=A0A0V0QY74_PSEPJ|nr:hypothetical protein PPERSA_00363 [Pseudocohnilembus persalinus]|eukprot:KRX07206.1 hypothetical protein PPERSA_00363 [Pseudocohnilembus persalinus]